ncbi:MAG: hypothetical protein HC897_14375 [Thermoanaerobaculia bacterium]|nr:hypothetical protein [Thermoanaerobaculia bacterium]
MFREAWKTRNASIAATTAMLLAAVVLAAKAQDVVSKDGKVAVKLDPTTDRNVIYSVADGKEWYSVPNLAGRSFLSEDGSYTATCHHWLGADARSKEIVVQFYRTGSAIADLTLGELVDRPKDLPKDGSFYRWGQCEGFTGGSRFSLDTAEGRRISLDLATGERFKTSGVWPPRPRVIELAAATPEPVPDPPSDEPPTPPVTSAPAAAPAELLTVSSYAPDGFCARQPTPVLCDDFKGGFQPGWQRVRGKWLVREELPLGGQIFSEHVLSQRSAEPGEGNLLFFFNRSFSNVEIRTLVRIDVESMQSRPAAGEEKAQGLNPNAAPESSFGSRTKRITTCFDWGATKESCSVKSWPGSGSTSPNPRQCNTLVLNFAIPTTFMVCASESRTTASPAFCTSGPKTAVPKPSRP